MSSEIFLCWTSACCLAPPQSKYHCAGSVLLLTTSFPVWFSVVLFSVSRILLVWSTIISVVLTSLSTMLFSRICYYCRYSYFYDYWLLTPSDYSLLRRFIMRIDDVIYQNFRVKAFIETSVIMKFRTGSTFIAFIVISICFIHKIIIINWFVTVWLSSM